jgi:hypothetical protein
MKFNTIFILLILHLTSCNNASRIYPKISTEKLDTLKIAPYPVVGNPAVFETAFFQDTHLQVDSLTINFYAVNIGKLNVESGKLIASDPIVMHDAKAFTNSFPIGLFPVQLAIANFKMDQRVAFSRVLFSDKSVAKWEFALLDGQKQIPIEGEEMYGFGVDAGIGLYIDKKANDAFNSLTGEDNKKWEEVFVNQMSKNDRNTWSYILYKFGKHNLAAFSTGYGDGTYATYIGYDEQGKICRLLTDFGIVDWLKEP